MSINVIQRRLITPIALRGNIGKSTTVSILSQWLTQREIPWKGIDFDSDHQSFSRAFPQQVQLVELTEEPVADVIKVMRATSEESLAVWDPRAHFADHVLAAWELVRFQELFDKENGRITTLLFPSDDVDVLSNLDQSVQRLGNSVDYVIVKNRARAPKIKMYDGSPLEADLVSLGAQTLEIPALLSIARNHLAALEAELGRGVTHSEAVGNKELTLDPMVRHIIGDWVRGIFRSFDALSPMLLPKSALSKIPKSNPVDLNAAIRRGAKINKINL